MIYECPVSSRPARQTSAISEQRRALWAVTGASLPHVAAKVSRKSLCDVRIGRGIRREGLRAAVRRALLERPLRRRGDRRPTIIWLRYPPPSSILVHANEKLVYFEIRAYSIDRKHREFSSVLLHMLQQYPLGVSTYTPPALHASVSVEVPVSCDSLLVTDSSRSCPNIVRVHGDYCATIIAAE